MQKRQVEKKAFDYFEEGFICAEAVSKTLLDTFAPGKVADVPRAATGFGGGIGGTKCETCGALTGGVIALGFLFGRMSPSGDKQKVYACATEFRNRFIDAFGATRCQAILDRLGPQENMCRCKELTAKAAGILFDLVRSEMDDQA